MPKEQRIQILKSFTPEQLAELERDWRWIARPKQLRCFEDDWNTFVLLAGRGFGKSRTACEWVRHKALTNPGCTIAVVGATASIVNRTVVNGSGGIMEVCRPGEAVYKRGDALIKFSNGTVVNLYSAEDPARLRGPNHHFALADDIIAWRYAETYKMLKLTLRLGVNPQMLVTTSAGSTPLILDILSNYSEDELEIQRAVDEVNAHEFLKRGNTIFVRGTTFENRALPAVTLEDYKTSFPPNTIIGQQELYAKIVLKVEGALWDRRWIKYHKAYNDNGEKLPEPTYVKTVVAIDPAVSVNKKSDHTALVVASLGADGKYYVRYAERGKWTSQEWAQKTIRLYDEYNCDYILAEKNNGGDLVEDTLRNVTSFYSHGTMYDVNTESLPIKLIHAKQGKYLRATPVATLYEAGQVFHVGTLYDLEHQMLTFKGEPKDDDDLVDAMVYAVAEVSGAKPTSKAPPRVGGTRASSNLQLL